MVFYIKNMPTKNQDTKRCDWYMVGEKKHMIRQKIILKKLYIGNIVYTYSVLLI